MIVNNNDSNDDNYDYRPNDNSYSSD